MNFTATEVVDVECHDTIPVCLNARAVTGDSDEAYTHALTQLIMSWGRYFESSLNNTDYTPGGVFSSQPMSECSEPNLPAVTCGCMWPAIVNPRSLHCG